MRHVTPSVRLIARPQIDWEEMFAYLDEIGAHDYIANRLSPAGTPPEEQYHNNVSNGEELIAFMGRLCYRSWEPGLNPNVSKVRTDQYEYLMNILASGHGSVTEHANYSFVFSNVSRVYTHELVRHRAGVAVSQESMRFVRLADLPFWFPEWAKLDEEMMQESMGVLTVLENHQIWMAEHFGLDDPGVSFSEKKAKTSFMRRFAPDGVATSIGMTANVRALRHMIKMRTELTDKGLLVPEEEIHQVFMEVGQKMTVESPALFGDFERITHPETGNESWVPRHVKI